MRKLLTVVLVFIVVSIVTLSSCKKKHSPCDDEKRYIPISKEIVDMFFFAKEGTKWVMEDSITKQTEEYKLYYKSESYLPGSADWCLTEHTIESKFAGTSDLGNLTIYATHSANNGEFVRFDSRVFNQYKYKTYTIGEKTYSNVIEIETQTLKLLWGKGIGFLKITFLNKNQTLLLKTISQS